MPCGRDRKPQCSNRRFESAILGIVEDYRSDKGSIFMDRTLYKRFWKDDAVDFVDVNLKPGENATSVKRKIDRLTTGTEHALVYTNAEFRVWIGSLVDQFFLLNYMQLVVAVIVAIVGIANTLIVSVLDRRREFAITRAVEATVLRFARWCCWKRSPFQL